MKAVIMPREMNELISRYVDTFEIEEDHARSCLETFERSRSTLLEAQKDPFVLMAYACMYYGCMCYTDALRCVERAKRLFVRRDNPLHYDVLCVLEVSILRALSRIPQALECVRRNIAHTEGACQRQLNLISIDLYRLQGKFEDAYLIADGLCDREHDDNAFDSAVLSQELCERDQDGDHQTFCTHLSSLYWSLVNDTGIDGMTRSLMAQYGSELAFSYAWQGRMDIASSILEKIRSHDLPHRSIAYLSASALSLGAVQKFDEALSYVDDEHLRIPGISLEEAFSAHVVRLILLHFAGQKREAVPLAVRLAEYAQCHPGLSLSVTAQMLLVSVYVWLYDFAQAQSLMGSFASDPSQNLTRASEKALHACLSALIANRAKGDSEACRLLKAQRSSICNPNASLLVAGLSAVHPPLIGLLGNALEVDSIPSNVTELLDHSRYHESITVSSGMLTKEQSTLFAQRFDRVDTGLKILYEDQSKPISIKLFGGLSIASQGDQVDLSRWSHSKAHQLFLRTALEQGADLPRNLTLAMLWPDMTKPTAANNYYVTLSKMLGDLKRTCGIADSSDIILRSSCGKIRLNVSKCECDVAQFEKAAISARRSMLAHEHQVALQHFYRMVELYTGDLLIGDHEYAWLAVPRDRYRKQFLDSMISACMLCLELGQPNETLFFIDAALKHDPGREAFYEMSLRAYKAMGRREDALNAYYECVEYLQETLGLDPSPELQKLFNELLTASS